MKRLSFQPLVTSARIHAKSGGSYQNEDEYTGSFIITLTDDVAHISMLTGVCDGKACTWDMECSREMDDYCRNIGAKRIEYKIKGKKVERDL